MCAITSDADTDGARRAALPLRLPDSMQNAFADALQIAVRAAQVL